jgi:aldehyde dehydrogenase (NAD+)
MLATQDAVSNPRAVLGQIPQLVAGVRASFNAGKTRPYARRIAQLDGLLRLLADEEAAIVEALQRDLGKPKLEAVSAEVLEVAMNVRYLKKHLKKWMKPERVPTPLSAQPGSSAIVREPLGVALIIAPWNYPFSMVVHPLAGALAAGNGAVVKPSEVAPATSALIARLLPRYLDPDCVAVVEGGVVETTELLAQRFDRILYTGNGVVGRIVMQAAVKHLTPVTLELGGKSPTFVDQSADLKMAAKRIAWAKFYNCGQTCVAPDYALVHRHVYDAFLQALTAAVRELWGEDPRDSESYGRIINGRHHARVMKLIESGGKKLMGGHGDVALRYIAPTLLTDVPSESAVMRDEIFGPVLPILEVDSVDDAVAFINAREKPLALYAFATDDGVIEKIVANTSAGGMLVNHAMLHVTVPGLPFGGIGESGTGAYHGKHSFETFSHRKGVHRRANWGEAEFIYPPYSESKLSWIRRFF